MMDVALHHGIGGPLDRFRRRLHVRERGFILLTIALTWVPLCILSLFERALTGRGDPLLHEPSIHVRLLVAIPLLLIAEWALDQSAGRALTQLSESDLVPAEQESRVDALLRAVERWRDSARPEIVLALLAAAIGVSSWFGFWHLPGVAHLPPHHGFAGGWYTLVSLPIFQFVLWRSLYRWALWVRILFGLARTPLALSPAHADRCGGLAFLKYPSLSFGALLLLAAGSVLASAWSTEILQRGQTLEALKAPLLVLLCIGGLLAIGPLLAFLPRLFLTRRSGRLRYGPLVSDYAQRFDARWLPRAHRDNPDLLGAPDFQSLADLSTVYQENVDKMRLLLFTPRDLIALLVASLLPALPLVLSLVPAKQVLMRAAQLLTGGLPG